MLEYSVFAVLQFTRKCTVKDRGSDVYNVQELSDKIAQLNAAIDEVSSQMKAKDPKPETIVEEVTV